ncbi:MAG: pyruvate ferredoxin oxidoreductase, partial [Lachnospiraceae bacterium]|nr:pyruvate ferredoxin oxidoreductase [Lachnospiraceae bacterium]
IQAYPIAEDKNVHLPVMICQDGFITSHAVQNIELLDDDTVKDFVGTYEPEEYLLNPGKPVSVGPYSISNYAMEAKKNQEIAMENSKEVILRVADAFERVSGRRYGLFEEYRTEDADHIMLIMGSAAGTAKQACDDLRDKGMKVGVLKLRVFRPFPAAEIAKALSGCKSVAIMDRCECYNGNGGPLSMEVCSALYKNKVLIKAVSYMYGLAGRDFTVENVYEIFNELDASVKGDTEPEQYRYIGLRSQGVPG